MKHKQSKVNNKHLTNMIGDIIEWEGEEPKWVAFQSVHPELFQHLERLYSKAYEIAGVSQLSANAQKPAGLDSGKALREFNDIESERFVLVGQAWEQFHLDAATHMIELAKEIFDETGKFSVNFPGKKFVEKIDWAEINLGDDEYVMKMFPTSMLSTTPSGKLADVQELMQAGLIDQPNGLRLLDFPDLESYTSLANAAIDDIEATIEAIVDRGEYNPPEPEQNLDLGIKMMLSSYLKAKNDKVDPDYLEMMRTWMSEARAWIQQASAPPMGPPGASQSPGMPAGGGGMPQGQPQAVPEAPPTSQLLPSMGGMQ